MEVPPTMLRRIRIRNLAVIEAVDVEFGPGLTVLTGETGAGKSILVEAVGLLLGARASADLVRTGESLATIEAIIDDGGRDVVVRRDITSQGRSRSFIDGANATAGALRDLAARLVELHGQHEHQALLDPQTHIPLLDHFAGLGDAASAVQDAWHALRALREQADRLRMDDREKRARLELLEFQLGEIRKVAPKPGEDDELASSRQVLANAERVRALCDDGYATLYERDDAVLAGLAGVWKRVAELAGLDPQFQQYLEARDAIKPQLEDLAIFLRTYRAGVDASPVRLREVEDRLAAIERLKKKYGPSLEDVQKRTAEFEREHNLLRGGGETSESLARAVADAESQFLKTARTLSAGRRAAAGRFGQALMSLLGELAMPRTQFDVRFAHDTGPDTWSERGIDQAEFYLSPNPGEDPRPLTRIVSGGELSRVMLALKTLAAADAPGKTLIFDEVDAGIGGRVADVVGARLQALGTRFQVLCITHLPQIAARGDTQFRIEKQVRSSRTVTSVERLDRAGRIEEIARMMSGPARSPSVLASASELLDLAREARAGAPAAKAKGKHNTKGESETGG